MKPLIHEATKPGALEDLRVLVTRAVDELRSPLIALSRDLYDHPELSLQEVRSSGLLQERLRAEGFEVTAGVAGLPTGFVAVKRGATPGPRVAFLAEFDALPGIGHACGHNIIASAGLGAGLALGRASDRLAGEVIVIGTPAEETVGGKCIMVREGVFKGIDAALMVHPGSEWRVEADSLACISLEVVFTGKEAHAVAWPERGINALDALIQLFVAVDMLKKRLGRDVRIPGVIVEGGVRANIVPARAVGHFSLRAPDSRTRDQVRAEFERTVDGIARGTGCGSAIRATDEPYDDLLTNKTLAAVFRRHLNDAGITTIEGPRANKGSLDMGNVSRVVPSVHAFAAICGSDVPSHSAAFALATISPRGEEALVTSARAMALTGLDLMTLPGLLGDAKAEFDLASS
ncbi:MAG TPA: M20 family metallopeptidase [Patescibacteria group bacterium]|nr:M20 family metallopeptidase [Patescibacteria group bacterium]